MPAATPSTSLRQGFADVTPTTTPPLVCQYSSLIKYNVIDRFSRVCARVLFVWAGIRVAL